MMNQIKTTSLIAQIQKMARGLNRFGISDVLQMFPDAEENNIREALIFLTKEFFIKQISETEYLYIKSKNITPEIVDSILEEKTSEWLTIDEVCKITGQKKETVRRKCKNKIYESKFIKNGKNKEYLILKSCISKNKQRSPLVEKYLRTCGGPKNYSKTTLEKFNRFKDLEERLFFDSLDSYSQRFVYKYLTVIKLAGDLRGRELRNYLKKLAQYYPRYKVAFTSYMRYFRLYAILGIKGLVPRTRKFDYKTCIPIDMYEQFKKIYLAPNSYGVEKVVNMLPQFGFDEMEIPNYKTFSRLLFKEFSKEQVEQIKRRPVVPANAVENAYLNDEKIKKNNSIYEKYIDAADAYYEKIKKIHTNTNKSRLGIVLNHLNPYFKNCNINQITQGQVQEFQSIKLAEGYTPSSIRRFTTTLSVIMETNNTDHSHLVFSCKDKLLPPVEQQLLSQKEIETLKKKPSIELWVLMLGIKVSELLALDYEDIDYENKIVNISKAMMNNYVQRYRKSYKNRKLKMPDILFETLPPKGRGRIFQNLEIKNYNILINTHVKLMLDKNVPINIISKLLGFQDLQEFDAIFGFLLPQQLDDDFDIFE